MLPVPVQVLRQIMVHLKIIGKVTVVEAMEEIGGITVEGVDLQINLICFVIAVKEIWEHKR